MRNTYKNIKEYAFGEHLEAFRILLSEFNKMSLHYFLIGAQARDVHFIQKGIKPLRATRDIDFAVMVDSMDHYNELMETLTKSGFQKSKDPFRLNWSEGETVIDLLPFGQIEQDYTVNFDKRNIELSVLGFRELNEELLHFYIGEDQSVSIPIPPLHGIFILKLLSWDDNKPGREKDLKDLDQILKKYWEFVENEAYEKHLDLFDDDFEMNKVAARILGRNLKTVLIKSTVLKNKVLAILETQVNTLTPPGLLIQRFAMNRNESIESVKEHLEEILIGIKE